MEEEAVSWSEESGVSRSRVWSSARRLASISDIPGVDMASDVLRCRVCVVSGINRRPIFTYTRRGRFGEI